MRTLAMILFLALCAGCSSQKPDVASAVIVDSTPLVQDAVSVMLAAYPPAQVRLALVQDASDPFGTMLVATLRSHGYAMAEYDKPIKGDKYLDLAKQPDGLAFGYLLDNGGSNDELQLHLHIGSDSLNRLYSVKTDGAQIQYAPQGFWTRRERGVDGRRRTP